MRWITALYLTTVLLLAGPVALAETTSPSDRMTPELLWQLGRLGEAAVSKDGQVVAYSVTTYDLAQNRGFRHLYLYELQSKRTRKLLSDWPSLGNLQFGKSPFGERLYLTGTADSGKKSQAWALNPVDGATLQVTDFEEGCANLKVAPSGSHLAFTQRVKLEPQVDEVHKDLPKTDGKIFDSLMFRHWDVWKDGKYSHLHVAPIGPDGKAGKALDLMEGLKVDCPVPPFGGSSQFDWSPDGKSLAFTMKDQERWAESTDSDIYWVDLSSPKIHRNLTEGMPGYDKNPAFSPDGKYLAFHSMERPSFEADRIRIMVLDLAKGTMTEATKGVDRWAHNTVWLPDSSGFVFSSEDRGTSQLFRVARSGGPEKTLTKGRAEYTLKAVFPDGKRALASFAQTERPDELVMVDLGSGSKSQISAINEAVMSRLQVPTVEERWVDTTDGKKMLCWVVYPPDFDAGKKWPMITYCQGGPQGQVGQWFSYRWNFHLMAAKGYVVVLPNRRGLPGFGQDWNDAISKDWGGQAMRDLLSATDALAAEPFIDKSRIAAVGPSFGGYSVYWLMGNAGDRFAAMIAHCGVFNLESMYGSTEELFFVNWELGGPYWKSPEIQKRYDDFSPHRYVENWKTPLLVIHNEKDYRVPLAQGLEAFTAAQVQGVPSRFLYFPEENHWVLQPQNAILWQRTFFEWLDQYCKEQAPSANLDSPVEIETGEQAELQSSP